MTLFIARMNERQIDRSEELQQRAVVDHLKYKQTN